MKTCLRVMRTLLCKPKFISKGFLMSLSVVLYTIGYNELQSIGESVT